MKKVYNAPVLEIEKYELNSSIAGNCTEVINIDPEECLDIWDMAADADLASFYDDATRSCDCYVTAGGEGYWTS